MPLFIICSFAFFFFCCYKMLIKNILGKVIINSFEKNKEFDVVENEKFHDKVLI